MIKHIVQVFITACMVGGCSPATLLSASPTLPPTATLEPTVTASPIPSGTPTITPYPPLQTQGPYLLFTRSHKNLTVMDADGSGQKHIRLPNNGSISQLNKAVSPDGKWLAYFTGSTEEPYDIALNLMNLSDETTGQISNLIAPGFPENLEPVMETMLVSEGDECSQDRECRMKLLQTSFITGIYSLDWSPDARSLAFAAQIDGPSSDLYIYTLEDKTVRRVTNDSQNIGRIEWAPNGNKIMYANSVPGSLYAGRTIHIADPDSKSIQAPPKLIGEAELWAEHDWFSENLYLFYEFNDTEPTVSQINLLNTDTGELKEVWPYTAEFFAINRETDTILLVHKNHANLVATVPEGIYMVYSSGEYLKISDLGIQFVIVEGQTPYPIFAQDSNRQIYSIDNDGTIHILPWTHDKIPRISPDGNLLLFREPRKLALYSNSYQIIKSWKIEDEHYSLTWSPDSLGVFILTDKNIYFLAISEEQPRVVEHCPLERCEHVRFVWLP